MKTTLLSLLLLLSSHNAFACYDESLSDKTNFDSCAAEAKQGSAPAQNNLGFMYHTGKGATQDYKEAVKWYRKAAEQEDVFAQYSLGFMYRFGEGIAQDYKSAHMWWKIAAANGYSDAAENRDLITKEMTPSQIEKAQDMAREWMAKHQ